MVSLLFFYKDGFEGWYAIKQNNKNTKTKSKRKKTKKKQTNPGDKKIKLIYQLVDVGVLADYQVKVKESEKLPKYRDLALGLENIVA